MREIELLCERRAAFGLMPGASPAHRAVLSRLSRFILMLIRSFLIALAIVALLTYIVCSPPVLTTLVPSVILSPSKVLPSDYCIGSLNGIKPQDVFFGSSSGNKLHGWFFQSTNPDAPVLLSNHGSGGNIAINAYSAERFLSHGLSVFVYDYSGFGKSTGKASMSSSLLDGDSAYDYLIKERKISSAKIILYGGSFGGSVACHIASSRPAAALILESSFSSLISVARKRIEYFNAYPKFLQTNPPLDSASVVKATHLPLLIIHGQVDSIIPISEAEYNFSVAHEPKTMVVLPHSGHFVMDADKEKYNSAFRSLLASLKK